MQSSVKQVQAAGSRVYLLRLWLHLGCSDVSKLPRGKFPTRKLDP